MLVYMEYYRGKYKHKENKTRTTLIHIIQKGIHGSQSKVVFNPPKNSLYSRIPTQSYHRAADTGSLTKVDVTGFVVHYLAV